MLKIVLNIVVIFIIFTGCSSRQYFEPENTDDSYSAQIHTTNKDIISLIKNAAILEDHRIITKDGISKEPIYKGYHLLNKNDTDTIMANKNGDIIINDKSNTFHFEKNVIAASKKGDLLSLIFTNNSMGIYEISTKKFKFREYQKESLINNIKIANPIFLENIILFPTLNGSILIISIKNFKILKTINLDPNSQINNVVFLETINDTMIAATTNKILTLGNSSFSIKDYHITDIIVHKENIYISTLDGNIIKFDLSLNKIASQKFKFAKIYALGFGTKLYALESQGFLIQLEDDLSNWKIYDFDFDETKKAIIIDNTLYFDQMYMKLN